VFLGERRSTAQRRGAQRGANRGRTGEIISVAADVSRLKLQDGADSRPLLQIIFTAS